MSGGARGTRPGVDAPDRRPVTCRTPKCSRARRASREDRARSIHLDEHRERAHRDPADAILDQDLRESPLVLSGEVGHAVRCEARTSTSRPGWRCREAHGRSIAVAPRGAAAGRESWYGQWRSSDALVKRKLGAKRRAGEGAGLTKAQAEAELRRRIEAERPSATRATDPRSRTLAVGTSTTSPGSGESARRLWTTSLICVCTSRSRTNASSSSERSASRRQPVRAT